MVEVLVCLVLICPLLNVVRAGAAVYTQEALGTGAEGEKLPQVIIEPESLPGLQTQRFDLGLGRLLEIRTNLAGSRLAEIDSVAAVVQRCYSHLESATGRTIPGGVLLYLLQYEKRPRYFRFETETREADNWSQVRVALLNRGQPVLGPGASRHVVEFLYDTLPHELTHTLLTVVPTVRHDRDGQSSQGTRWFIDGTCEVLAKSFAAREAPSFWRQALMARGVHWGAGRAELYEKVWRWGQENELSWSDESDLYGTSLLLVDAWTNEIRLPDLLDLMSSRGGDLDGTALLDLLHATTGLDRVQLVAVAQATRRRPGRSTLLSLGQTQ